MTKAKLQFYAWMERPKKKMVSGKQNIKRERKFVDPF